MTCFLSLILNNVSLRVMHAVSQRLPDCRSQGDCAGTLYGTIGRVSAMTCIHLYLFTTLAAYLNSLGRTIMNELYEQRVCLPVATACALCVLMPFAQLRSYGDITTISLLSFAAVIVLVLLIMSASSHVEPDAAATTSFWPPSSLSDSLTSAGGFFFASGGGQCAFFEYLSEMENPGDYTKTLWLTTPVLFVLYYGVAAVMYNRFGDRVPGFLLDILPFDLTRLLGNTLFFFHIVVSFTILNTALLRSYATYSVTDDSWAAKREWAMMSVVVLAGAYVVTNIFSLFEDMTAAVGALLVTSTVLLIPPVYLLAAGKRNKNIKGKEGEEGDAGVGGGRGGGGEGMTGNGDGNSGGGGGGLSTATSFGLHAMILFGLIVVPLMSWGAIVRLIHDTNNVAPPFSCGPCVTRECIEGAKNASYGHMISRKISSSAAAAAAAESVASSVAALPRRRELIF